MENGKPIDILDKPLQFKPRPYFSRPRSPAFTFHTDAPISPPSIRRSESFKTILNTVNKLQLD